MAECVCVTARAFCRHNLRIRVREARVVAGGGSSRLCYDKVLCISATIIRTSLMSAPGGAVPAQSSLREVFKHAHESSRNGWT